jgi:hypothetical protein
MAEWPIVPPADMRRHFRASPRQASWNLDWSAGTIASVTVTRADSARRADAVRIFVCATPRRSRWQRGRSGSSFASKRRAGWHLHIRSSDPAAHRKLRTQNSWSICASSCLADAGVAVLGRRFLPARGYRRAWPQNCRHAGVIDDPHQNGVAQERPGRDPVCKRPFPLIFRAV